MKKILHLIPTLAQGGAENSLYSLIANDEQNQHKIITFLDFDNHYQERFLVKNIEIENVDLNQSWRIFRFYMEIKKIIDHYNPDLIQTWMYHSNFLSIFLRFWNETPIYWNIRHTDLNLKNNKLRTIFLAKICAYLSKFIPKKVIYVAKASYQSHVAFGYCKNNAEIIHNGIDTTKFMSDPHEKAKFKELRKISEDTILVGMIANLDQKQKDITTFLKAANFLNTSDEKYAFILAGRHATKKNNELSKLINTYNLKDSIYLLGQLKNPLQYYTIVDISVLCSHGEGFPNVVAEAMSCQATCISNDVGEASHIIGSAGFTFKINDYEKLFNIIHSLKINEISERGLQSRERIKDKFSINKMIRKYNSIWASK